MMRQVSFKGEEFLFIGEVPAEGIPEKGITGILVKRDLYIYGCPPNYQLYPDGLVAWKRERAGCFEDIQWGPQIERLVQHPQAKLNMLAFTMGLTMISGIGDLRNSLKWAQVVRPETKEAKDQKGAEEGGSEGKEAGPQAPAEEPEAPAVGEGEGA